MNYDIVNLMTKSGTPNGRYKYSHLYQYQLRFTAERVHRVHTFYQRFVSASNTRIEWAEALHWCQRTWGWSADAQTTSVVSGIVWDQQYSVDLNNAETRVINPHWTYMDATFDRSRELLLHIYLKSGEELAFFKLAHPVDHK